MLLSERSDELGDVVLTVPWVWELELPWRFVYYTPHWQGYGSSPMFSFLFPTFLNVKLEALFPIVLKIWVIQVLTIPKSMELAGDYVLLVGLSPLLSNSKFALQSSTSKPWYIGT